MLASLVQSAPELRDAYSALLTSIQLNAPAGGGKSILITSTQPGEGKTTLAAGLAVAAMLSGRTVLLIDGDLRRPSLGALTGIGNGIGFGEVLEGSIETEDAIRPVELFDSAEGIGTLSVMGAGGKSPEFLAAVDWARARATVRSIARRFDLVLFDLPPILAANDALLLAGIVDGVLLVVGAGSADRDEVRRAMKQVEPVGISLIGAVLNRFDPKAHGAAHRPYSGYNFGTHR